MNEFTPYVGESLHATVTNHTIARVFLGTFEMGHAVTEGRRH